jgi:hypothetical protein
VRGRFGLGAGSAISLALLLAPAGAVAMQARVGLPKPGTTTVAVSQLVFKGKIPRHPKVHVINPGRLPPSDLGLYAIYGIHRNGHSILTAYSILLRRQAASASAEPADSDVDFKIMAQAFTGHTEAEEEAEDEEQYLRFAQQIASAHASTKPSRAAEQLLEEGGVKPPTPADSDDLGPSLIETGHYDDGHSFGWNRSGTEAAIGNWQRLSENGAPYAELVTEVESRLGADLDGDGEVRSPRPTNDTVVGAPVVEGGGP